MLIPGLSHTVCFAGTRPNLLMQLCVRKIEGPRPAIQLIYVHVGRHDDSRRFAVAHKSLPE